MNRESPNSRIDAAPQPPERELMAIVEEAARYVYWQRDCWLSCGVPLSPAARERLSPYFDSRLLDTVRIAYAIGAQKTIPDPPLRTYLRQFVHMGPLAHRPGALYNDVIVRFGEDSPPYHTLFYGMVHATQCAELGVRGYIHIYLQSLIRTGAWWRVPMEAHAFGAAARYIASASHHFSVPKEVHEWIVQRRY